MPDNQLGGNFLKKGLDIPFFFLRTNV